MLHQIGTTHVINKVIETIIVTGNSVVIIKTIDVDLTQFQLIVCIYSHWISVHWQWLG